MFVAVKECLSKSLIFFAVNNPFYHSFRAFDAFVSHVFVQNVIGIVKFFQHGFVFLLQKIAFFIYFLQNFKSVIQKYAIFCN